MTRPPRLLSLLFILSWSILFMQCDGLPDDPYDNLRSSLDVDLANGFSNIDFNQAQSIINSLPFDALSNQEIKGIEFLREEEKVIMEYYNEMAILYDTEVFDALGSSEATHFAVLRLLLDKYGLDDPAAGMLPGAFKSQSLQAHYNESIAEGTASELSAFTRGAILQEVSLVILRNQLDRVANNRDLQYIYESLLVGTRNHLRIMIAEVRMRGGNYTARFIDPSDLAEIVGGGFELG